MVAAGDDAIPVSEVASHSGRRVHGLATALEEAHHLRTGHEIDHELGDAAFKVDRQRRDDNAVDLLFCGSVNLRMAVTEGDGAAAQSEVDVLVAVDVPDTAAVSPVDLGRLVV